MPIGVSSASEAGETTASVVGSINTVLIGVVLSSTLLLIALGIYAFVSMEIDRRNIASGKTVVKTKGDKMQL